MHKLFWIAALALLIGCGSSHCDPNTVVFLIEASPANLDPRVGTDGRSEHIDELPFDGLVAKDASFHFTPALAEGWQLRYPVTLIFHLREARQIFARDLPAINLWYRDTVVVHNKRLTNVHPSASGSFAFLETAELSP